jgi:hypothetical protein
MTLYAKEDIRSYNRQLLYAEKGDEVTLMRDSIYESKRGRFPCTPDRLTDEKPVPPEIILRAPKSNDKDQLNLFGL